MALENVTVKQVVCDWCGARGPSSPSALAACAEADVVGWESVHDVHACPRCVELGANSEAPPELVLDAVPANVRVRIAT